MKIGSGFGPGFGMGFGMFQIMFSIMFLLIIGAFAATIICGISRWKRNNNSPRLTVPAAVVAKRSHESRHRRGGASGHHHHTSTSYYVTFQVESGDRIELELAGAEYGLLVEGDNGKLSFQGTRYLGFERL